MGWVNPFKHLINYGTLVHSTDAGLEVTPRWGTRRRTSYITFNRRLLSALAKDVASNAFYFSRLFESSCQAAQEVLQSSRFSAYVHIMVPKAGLLCCTLQANCLPSNLSSAILWLCGFWQAPYLFKHIKDFDSPARRWQLCVGAFTVTVTRLSPTTPEFLCSWAYSYWSGKPGTSGSVGHYKWWKQEWGPPKGNGQARGFLLSEAVCFKAKNSAGEDMKSLHNSASKTTVSISFSVMGRQKKGSLQYFR